VARVHHDAAHGQARTGHHIAKTSSDYLWRRRR
jgi:hypothetical protein